MKYLLFIVVMTLASCDGKKKSGDQVDDSPSRSGFEVPLEELSKFDGEARLSADGNKLIFLSGRDNVMRVYRYEVPDLVNGETSATPTRVTANEDNLDSEIEATISPDGTWVAFIGSKDASVDVYLKKFTDATEMIKVGDDNTGVESSVVFSRDSKMLAFVRREQGKTRGKLFVGQIDSSGLVGSLQSISADEEDDFDPVWQPTGTSGTYLLVSRQRTGSDFNTAIVKRSISVSGTTITVTASEKASSQSDLKRSISPDGNLIATYFVSNNFNEAYKEGINPSGGISDTKVPVRSVVRLINTNNTVLTVDGVTGIDVLSLSSTSDGLFGLWTLREPIKCGDDIEYTQTMFFYNQAEGSFSRIIPLSSKTDGEFEVTTQVCDKKRNDEADGEGDHDRRVSKAVINGSATQTAYTIAYVTLQSDDNEVRLFRLANEQYYFLNVSNNKK